MELRLITAVETQPLRRQELYAQDDREDVSYPGDNDERAIHIGAFVGVSVVAVVSFLPQDLPSRTGGFRIRGLVVLAAVNRRGLGRSLVEFGIPLVKEAGATYIWCNARENSIPFFERLGFVSISDLFDVTATGLHRRMVRKL